MAVTALQKPKTEKAYVFAWEGVDRRGNRSAWAKPLRITVN